VLCRCRNQNADGRSRRRWCWRWDSRLLWRQHGQLRRWLTVCRQQQHLVFKPQRYIFDGHTIPDAFCSPKSTEHKPVYALVADARCCAADTVARSYPCLLRLRAVRTHLARPNVPTDAPSRSTAFVWGDQLNLCEGLAALLPSSSQGRLGFPGVFFSDLCINLP